MSSCPTSDSYASLYLERARRYFDDYNRTNSEAHLKWAQDEIDRAGCAVSPVLQNEVKELKNKYIRV